MSYTEITTEEAAFKKEGLNIATLDKIYEGVPEKFRKHVINHFKLMVVISAINEGWEPDWTNTKQRKYYPWWEIIKRGSGAALSLFVVYYNYSYATVGARLVLENRDKVRHLEEYFTPLFEECYFCK